MNNIQKKLLLEQSLDIVDKIVKASYIRFNKTVPFKDIKSYALMGLAESIEKYDPSKGVSVDVFAASRIKGAIYDGISSQGSILPRRVIRQINFYKKADEILKRDYINPPPEDKITAANQLADRLKDLATAYVTISSNDAIDLAVNNSCNNEIKDAEYLLSRKEYYEKIREKINFLPEHHKTIITRFFFEEHQLKDIAAELGRSKSWVTRALRSALLYLRKQFNEVPDL
jgi:RNA polymerase sigma factor for flagellar operon FliA